VARAVEAGAAGVAGEDSFEGVVADRVVGLALGRHIAVAVAAGEGGIVVVVPC